VDPSYTPNHFPTCDQPPSIPTNTNQKSDSKNGDDEKRKEQKSIHDLNAGSLFWFLLFADNRQKERNKEMEQVAKPRSSITFWPEGRGVLLLCCLFFSFFFSVAAAEYA
jgi:hypothetical protein